MWEALATAAITGGAFGLIQFLVTRHDNNKEKKDGVKAMLEALQKSLAEIKADIDKKFLKAEKDALRTQLLVMICDRPNEQQEILTVAEHYFVKLKADWYMTSIFKSWCDDHGLEPDWFDSKE